MKAFGHLFMAAAALVLALPMAIVAGAALNGGRTMLFPPKDPTLARFASSSSASRPGPKR